MSMSILSQPTELINDEYHLWKKLLKVEKWNKDAYEFMRAI